jgi:hypothetical protein
MASPLGKLGQNLNVAGVSLFMRVVLVRRLARHGAMRTR